MAGFIVGSVNQGMPKVGEVFSAYRQNTLFITGVCRDDTFLDLRQSGPEVRSYLRSLGSLLFSIGDIFSLQDATRVAEMHMIQDTPRVWTDIVRCLFGGNLEGYEPQQPSLMTLSPTTRLNTGELLSVGYLSVMEPCGEGTYRLHHDYPVCSCGPRYEIYDNEHDA